jgi:hypothetical protein
LFASKAKLSYQLHADPAIRPELQGLVSEDQVASPGASGIMRTQQQRATLSKRCTMLPQLKHQTGQPKYSKLASSSNQER